MIDLIQRPSTLETIVLTTTPWISDATVMKNVINISIDKIDYNFNLDFKKDLGMHGLLEQLTESQ